MSYRSQKTVPKSWWRIANPGPQLAVLKWSIRGIKKHQTKALPLNESSSITNIISEACKVIIWQIKLRQI